MSLTDFKAKINKYKINNNNKTNTKHEFNVKYERYKQDISKDTLQMQKKSEKTHIFAKTCLPIFCKCGEPCNRGCYGQVIIYNRGCRGRDRLVVGFITTYAISAYHH